MLSKDFAGGIRLLSTNQVTVQEPDVCFPTAVIQYGNSASIRRFPAINDQSGNSTSARRLPTDVVQSRSITTFKDPYACHET